MAMPLSTTFPIIFTALKKIFLPLNLLETIREVAMPRSCVMVYLAGKNRHSLALRMRASDSLLVLITTAAPEDYDDGCGGGRGVGQRQISPYRRRFSTRDISC